MSEKRSISRLKNLLELLTKDDFKYFNRVKSPEKALTVLLREVRQFVPVSGRSLIDNILGKLEHFEKLNEEKKKLFVLDIKQNLERILEGKERILVDPAPLIEKKNYPIKAFFQNIDAIKGIQKARLKRLKKLGIKTVMDVVQYFPFRYEDRTLITPISFLVPDIPALSKGKILSVNVVETPKKKQKILTAVVYDKTGHIKLLFLQKKVINYYKFLFEKAKKLNKEVLFYGVPKKDIGGLRIVHPEVEILGRGEKPEKFGRIIPVYHSAEGIKQATVRKDIQETVKKVVPFLPEFIPESILKKYSFPKSKEAYWRMHFPYYENPEEVLNFKAPFQKRVIFDELFLFQLALAMSRKKVKSFEGISFKITDEMIEEFKSVLPFKLTNAQERVLSEIVEDMKKPEPMNRLLQGDVGSGKTIIATACAYFAHMCGYQTAVMAPTEILAVQHHKRFVEVLKKLGVRVGLLTGSMSKSSKELVKTALKQGFFSVVVGTHALIQEGVEFKNLGLVIVDEQHRFGVKQRLALRKKGELPDTLVMTATPIPRTLAMTAYGDLDISTIDELPEGRKPVKTKVLSESQRESLLPFLKREIEKGGKVFIVYPLIEESEKLNLKSATEMFKYWQEKLNGCRIGLLHGKMKQEEKDEVMEKFRKGELDVLVSTTVIEVGIDVPSATVMVVEHAERFGLAQLHQLRGRVGRGEKQSYCFLIASENISAEALKRLKVLEETNDGFKVATADLEMRGPGEIFGVKQSGTGEFKIADISRDFEILKIARKEAMRLIEENPELKGLDNLKELLNIRFGGRFDFADAG